MQTNTEDRARLVGGLALITLGILALISQAGIVTGDALAWLWVIGFGVWAAIFTGVYLTWRQPWAILVAYIEAAIALIILFAAIIDIGDLLPPAVLLLIAAPFVVAWWLDRQQWGLLIPAYVLVAIALGLLLTRPESNENLFVAYIMAAIGAPFLVGWLVNRRNWGLLIPAYVMLAIAFAFLLNLSDSNENLFVTYILWVIGAPFLLAAAFTRQWPFLIPGGIMFIIGAFFLIGSGEALATLSSALVALILIGAGAVLLYRAYSERKKPGE